MNLDTNVWQAQQQSSLLLSLISPSLLLAGAFTAFPFPPFGGTYWLTELKVKKIIFKDSQSNGVGGAVVVGRVGSGVFIATGVPGK